MVNGNGIPEVPPLLTAACTNGDLPSAESLYREMISEDASDKIPTLEQMAILSARNNHPSILSFCFSEGLILDLNAWRHLDIVYACYDSQSIPIHRIFLSNGLPITYTDELFSPMASACMDCNLELARFLLDEGVDPDKHSWGPGCYPLVWAIVGNDHPSEDRVKVVKLLLERGTRVTETGALIAAIDEGNIAIVDLLLRHGESTGDLPLEEVEGKYYGDYDNRHSDDVGTALFKAAAAGQAEIVDMLLDKGADPTFRTKKGKSVADVAEEGGHWEIAREVRGVVEVRERARKS